MHLPPHSDRGFWTAALLVGLLLLRVGLAVVIIWLVANGADATARMAFNQIADVLTVFIVGVVGAAAVQVYRWLGAQQNGNGAKSIPPFQPGDGTGHGGQ
jgi:glucan phosphoethanolaminetransferase (alkaline phosphatase superfamily)